MRRAGFTTPDDSRLWSLASLRRARERAREYVFEHLPRPDHFPSLPPLPKLDAAVFRPDDPGYDAARYQYATTTQPSDAMAPGAVIRPRAHAADTCVAEVLSYAQREGIAVALRSGGHCYAGTSSCGPAAIQLDLAEAYRDFEANPAAGTVRVGVGLPLAELVRRLSQGDAKKLGSFGSKVFGSKVSGSSTRSDTRGGLFVPTGVCGGVHVGGHAQTGGFGLLLRSFGTFADHVISATLLTANGRRHEIAPDAPEPLDRELFWGVFGAGPGNFGVLTHVTLRPRRDADHPHARTYRAILPMTDAGAMRALNERLAALTLAVENAPRGYDFGFVVFSGHESFWRNAFGIARRSDLGPAMAPPVPVVAVCFQYGNVEGPRESYDPRWCAEAKRIVADFERHTARHPAMSLLLRAQKQLGRLPDDRRPTPVSHAMSRVWLSGGAREFRAPLLKSSITSGGTVDADLPRFVADSIDEAMAHGHMVQSIFQSAGGRASALRNPTRAEQAALSWRDAGCYWLFDLSFDPHDQADEAWARAWRARVTAEGQTKMRDDRARAWFGFLNGDVSLREGWSRYFDDEAKYERALRLKAEVDPGGVFSATPFHLATSDED
ncbi:MAG: FAD-binding oxidoreductase [Sandaracinus sp.]|nr:FAD-binding oxidoreductase [Sandaracinus sp.]